MCSPSVCSRCIAAKIVPYVGVMVWEVFANGSEPYKGMTPTDTQMFVLNGKRLEFPADTPKPAAELVTKRCWDANPETRWSMDQVSRWSSCIC